VPPLGTSCTLLSGIQIRTHCLALLHCLSIKLIYLKRECNKKYICVSVCVGLCHIYPTQVLFLLIERVAWLTRKCATWRVMKQLNYLKINYFFCKAPWDKLEISWLMKITATSVVIGPDDFSTIEIYDNLLSSFRFVSRLVTDVTYNWTILISVPPGYVNIWKVNGEISNI